MKSLLPLLIATGMLGACGTAITGPARLATGASPFGDMMLPLKSVEERRFAGIIRQRYDFSCGSAALATLLRHHYGFAVDEETSFRGMWSRGDRAAIRRVGFSLLDMKRWLASRGLGADGYKVSLDAVARTGVPGIALIAIKNYRHFVVVKGVRGEEVLLGDPSSGLVIMPRATFEQSWNGIYFVLAGDVQAARGQFNQDRQWAAFNRSPMSAHFTVPMDMHALSAVAPYLGDI